METTIKYRIHEEKVCWVYAIPTKIPQVGWHDENSIPEEITYEYRPVPSGKIQIPREKEIKIDRLHRWILWLSGIKDIVLEADEVVFQYEKNTRLKLLV